MKGALLKRGYVLFVTGDCRFKGNQFTKTTVEQIASPEESHQHNEIADEQQEQHEEEAALSTSSSKIDLLFHDDIDSHHHHHQVMLIARIFQTRSLQSARSSIARGRSSG